MPFYSAPWLRVNDSFGYPQASRNAFLKDLFECAFFSTCVISTFIDIWTCEMSLQSIDCLTI